jgi:hypothetical protein
MVKKHKSLLVTAENFHRMPRLGCATDSLNDLIERMLDVAEPIILVQLQRALTTIAAVPRFLCNHCCFTQYMDNVKLRGKPDFSVTDDSIAYVGNPRQNKPKMCSMGGLRKPSRFKRDIIGSEGPDEEAKALAEKHAICLLSTGKKLLPNNYQNNNTVVAEHKNNIV